MTFVPRSDRLLSILQVLRNKRLPVTAESLAQEFGVSRRTIYRDMAGLSAQGAVVEGEAGVGYILRGDHFLPPLMLDATEADALVLGLRFVMRRGDPELAQAAEAALGKIDAVLPEDVALSARTNGLLAGPISTPNPTIAVLRELIRSEHKAQIEYQAADGGSTLRTVWPLALGFMDRSEVVAAWCELRAGFRHFHLDRIVSTVRLQDRLPAPRRVLMARWAADEPLGAASIV